MTTKTRRLRRVTSRINEAILTVQLHLDEDELTWLRHEMATHPVTRRRASVAITAGRRLHRAGGCS